MAARPTTGKDTRVRGRAVGRNWDLSGADVYHRATDQFIVKNERTNGLYPVGQNFCFFVGRCTAAPWMGRADTEHRAVAWFKLAVPDLLDRRRNLFVHCRCDNELAAWALENVFVDTEVAVTGQMYTGVTKRKDGDFAFTYLICTRVSANIPILPEQDGQYVRVRADLVQHLIANASAETREAMVEELTAEMERVANSEKPPAKETDPLYNVTDAAQDDDRWFLRPANPQRDDIEIHEDTPE